MLFIVLLWMAAVGVAGHFLGPLVGLRGPWWVWTILGGLLGLAWLVGLVVSVIREDSTSMTRQLGGLSALREDLIIVKQKLGGLSALREDLITVKRKLLGPAPK